MNQDLLALLDATGIDFGGVQLKAEYLVVGAAGWPGGYNPHPQTYESALDFIGEHGGVMQVRIASSWSIVDL